MNAVSSQENAATNAALDQASPKAGAQASSQLPTIVLSSTGSAAPKAHSKSAVHKGGAHVKAVSVAPVAIAPNPTAKKDAPAPAPVAVNVASSNAAVSEDDAKPALDSKYNANGRRDPFISPVVSHAGGSGCSTGKKCLEIGAINLRGVVHSESGFIAVVSNDINKAYFLRENDPVFNGYVVKITGDSIVFQETLQDRLGKTFTREVVKKITTPAV
jgi:Tfp pilus assembly protein PilP